MGKVNERIRIVRQDQGMSQQDVADKMHLSKRAWQNIESGATRIDIDRLKEIAGVLDVSVEELLQSEGIFINSITHNEAVGFHSNMHVHHFSENEKNLYEQLIQEKDRLIAAKDKEIALLHQLLDGKRKG